MQKQLQPFYFGPQRYPAHNSQELISLCQNDPDSGFNHFQQKDIEKWLRYTKDRTTLKLLKEAKRQYRQPSEQYDHFVEQSAFIQTFPPEFASILADENFATLLEEEKNRPFVFVIVGRTGVGKSRTINSLMGKKLARVSDYVVGTLKVEEYQSPPNSFVKYTVFDTPGLADKNGADTEYLSLIKEKLNGRQIDCLWYMSLLGDTRVRDDEASTIANVTKAFSKRIWERSIIVFSHADKVSVKKYNKTLEERTNLLRAEIAVHAGEKIADEIPSIAIANDEDDDYEIGVVNTPDGKPWLNKLFTAIFTRMSKEGLAPFIIEIGMGDRFTESIDGNSTQDLESPSSNPQNESQEETEPTSNPSEPAPIFLSNEEKKTVWNRFTKDVLPRWGNRLKQLGSGIKKGVTEVTELTAQVAQTTTNISRAVTDVAALPGKVAASPIAGFFSKLNPFRRGKD